MVSNVEWRPGNTNHILSVLIYEYTEVTGSGHCGVFMQNFSIFLSQILMEIIQVVSF